MSTFSGLSTALSGMTAYRRGLDVAGQNVANANTEGYTRQRLELASVETGTVPGMYTQSTLNGPNLDGVKVTDLTRVRDAFLDARNRNEHASNSYLVNQKDVYGQIEGIVGEPSDSGIQAQLGDMWAGFHDVANNPADPSARSQLLGQAKTVAESLNQAARSTEGLWTQARDKVDALAVEVNTAANQVAELNKIIAKAQVDGNPANDAMDRRDLLTMKLAELTGASTTRQSDGTVTVSLGNGSLVAGGTARKVEGSGAGTMAGQAGSPVALKWTDTQGTAAVTSGQLASTLETLSTTLPNHMARLDAVAAKLADTVNTQHTAGYDQNGGAGGTFFDGNTAASIAVAVTDPAKVAAAATPGTLDGSNATALADLAKSATGADRMYRQLVGDLGTASATITQRATVQANLTATAENAVSAVSGVNLDEEMTNMLQFQRAYEASARVMNVVDATLDTLINRTGV